MKHTFIEVYYEISNAPNCTSYHHDLRATKMKTASQKACRQYGRHYDIRKNGNVNLIVMVVEYSNLCGVAKRHHLLSPKIT